MKQPSISRNLGIVVGILYVFKEHIYNIDEWNCSLFPTHKVVTMYKCLYWNA